MTRQEVLTAFAQGTRRILKSNLSRLIVYGSYARGDYKENSDIDVMILTPLSKEEIEKVENQIFDALIEKVQGEIPEEMYEQEVEESINNFAYRLQSQGLNLETYLKYTGMDVNAIKEQFRPQSEKQLKLRLALEKIAELENLEVSDEAVEEEYEKLAKQYNMEVAQIKNLVAETQIRADLKNQKAIDFVKENASVKAEKPAKKTTRRKSTKKAAEEKTEETAEAKTEE